MRNHAQTIAHSQYKQTKAHEPRNDFAAKQNERHRHEDGVRGWDERFEKNGQRFVGDSVHQEQRHELSIDSIRWIEQWLGETMTVRSIPLLGSV